MASRSAKREKDDFSTRTAFLYFIQDPAPEKLSRILYTMKLIEIEEQVEFSYAEDKNCVYCIPEEIEMHLGKSYSIEGISGSGKSTVLTLLAVLRRFNKGRVRYSFPGSEPVVFTKDNWRNLAGPEIWGKMGFSFQKPEMLRALTAGKNLELAVGSARLEEMALSLFDEDEWNDIKDKRVWKISGGQAQRLGIIRSFGSNQSMVFMDEPTNNLDKSNREKVVAFIQKFRGDRAVVFVSHDTLFLKMLEIATTFEISEKEADGGLKKRILNIK